ncbi:hypothetical protein F4808DRAFT_464541 [Astrocystis sublimbata]|nr:hypothetical protein F4808DRAFT_464541 [Astrocystis sublimbata]
MKLKCMRDRTFPYACVRCLQSSEQCLTGPPKPLGRAARGAAAEAAVAATANNNAIITPEQIYPALSSSSSSLSSSSSPADNLSDTFVFGENVFSGPVALNIFDDTLQLGGGGGGGGLDADAADGLLSLIASFGHVHDSTGEDFTMAGAEHDNPKEQEASLLPSGGIPLNNESSNNNNNNNNNGKSTWQGTSDMVVRLSQLNLTLSQQLSFFTISSWQETLAETATPELETSRSTPICRVLGLMSDFVCCIRQQASLAYKRPPPPPPPPPPPVVPVFPPQQAWDSDNGSSSSFLPMMPTAPWFTGPQSDTTQSPSEMSADEEVPEPDLGVVAIPTLLSCYLYLVAIFGIYFRHLRTLLSRHPPSFLTTLQLVPGFCLAGLPLDHGALQVRVLLQVVEHQFVTMEAALCLLDEHRVVSRQSVGREIGLQLTDVMGGGVALSATRIIASLRKEMALVRRCVQGDVDHGG